MHAEEVAMAGVAGGGNEPSMLHGKQSFEAASH